MVFRRANSNHHSVNKCSLLIHFNETAAFAQQGMGWDVEGSGKKKSNLPTHCVSQINVSKHTFLVDKPLWTPESPLTSPLCLATQKDLVLHSLYGTHGRIRLYDDRVGCVRVLVTLCVYLLMSGLITLNTTSAEFRHPRVLGFQYY